MAPNVRLQAKVTAPDQGEDLALSDHLGIQDSPDRGGQAHQFTPQFALAAIPPSGFSMNALWKTQQAKPEDQPEPKLGTVTAHKFSLTGPQGKYTVTLMFPFGDFSEKEIELFLKVIEITKTDASDQVIYFKRYDKKEDKCHAFYGCRLESSPLTIYIPMEATGWNASKIIIREIFDASYKKSTDEKRQKWDQILDTFLEVNKLLLHAGQHESERYEMFFFSHSYTLLHKDWLFADTVHRYYLRPDEFAHQLWELSQEDIPKKYQEAIKDYWEFIEQEVFQGQRFTTHGVSPFNLDSLVRAMAQETVLRNENLDDWFFSYPVDERQHALTSYWHGANTRGKLALLEHFDRFWQEEEVTRGMAFATLLEFTHHQASLSDSSSYKIEHTLSETFPTYLPRFSLDDNPIRAEEFFQKLYQLQKETKDYRYYPLNSIIDEVLIGFILRLFEDPKISSGYQTTYKSFDFKQEDHTKFFVSLASIKGKARAEARQALEQLISPEDLAQLMLTQIGFYNEIKENLREIINEYGNGGVLCRDPGWCNPEDTMKWALTFMEEHPKYHTEINLSALRRFLRQFLASNLFRYEDELEVGKKAIRTYGKIAGKEAIPLLRKIRTKELGKVKRIIRGQMEWQRRGVVKTVNETIKEIRRAER